MTFFNGFTLSQLSDGSLRKKRREAKELWLCSELMSVAVIEEKAAKPRSSKQSHSLPYNFHDISNFLATLTYFKFSFYGNFFPMKHLLEYSWAFGGTSTFSHSLFIYLSLVRLLMSAFFLSPPFLSSLNYIWIRVWIFFSPSSARNR